MDRREIARTIEKLVSGLIAVFIVARVIRPPFTDVYGVRNAAGVCIIAAMSAYVIWRPEHADADAGQSTGFVRYSQSPGCIYRVAAWTALLAIAAYLLLFISPNAA